MSSALEGAVQPAVVEPKHQRRVCVEICGLTEKFKGPKAVGHLYNGSEPTVFEFAGGSNERLTGPQPRNGA